MDDLHARLARLGLSAAAEHGFVLAGGYAVQAHGFLQRISDDVDLFTNKADPAEFHAAVQAVRRAFASDGLDVELPKTADTFARFVVTDEAGRSTKVEMGYDWRAEPPTVLDFGPVLHPDDAVANKVSAIFSRAEARDYVDVVAALSSGRYTTERLLSMAEERDPGFDRGMFAHALRAAERWDPDDYKAYGLDDAAVNALHDTLRAWADDIERA